MPGYPAATSQGVCGMKRRCRTSLCHTQHYLSRLPCSCSHTRPGSSAAALKDPFVTSMGLEEILCVKDFKIHTHSSGFWAWRLGAERRAHQSA
eukprot:1160325-Pelagomonas_calceolata.AAC.11